jgi:predicted nucleotidyltransferase
MIYMESRHWEIVKAILHKYPYTFYAFGSRVKNTQKKLSDLDICFMDTISSNVLSHMREDFEESNLPFTVDLVDWNTCDEDFRTQIKPDLVLIQTAPIITTKE